MTSTKKRFELIEHTADIGLTAYGDTLAETFANAAFGLFSIIADLDNVRETESRSVEVGADDAQMLLVDWLNELIYLFDVERLLFKRFEISHFETSRLKANCFGERYDPSRHQVKLGVKAATYHRVQVDPLKNQVRVILDV